MRIVCNSDLDVSDITISKAARDVAIKAKFNDRLAEVEALPGRERYRRLYDLLVSGRVKVRVVPRDKVFLHGKAGVIENPKLPRGKTRFLGSINETRNAFASNDEILWEDPSAEGVAWVDAEFEALWEVGHDLPEAIVEEVGRIAERIEIRFAAKDHPAGDAGGLPEGMTAGDLPGATLAESPIYRGGEQLQPWQRAFVTTFLEHRELYGGARILLADEVGLGKTLSLATSAMMGALLGDGPVLILCPSMLTSQWQVELKDRLGIPSAVWSSGRKEWYDHRGHRIRTRGAEDIARCPFQIAIASTGLIVHNSAEAQVLQRQRLGTLVLDEAHKARPRGGVGQGAGEPNNLLRFMKAASRNARHVLLGTATPIQTEVTDLWDLLDILAEGSEAVFGRPMSSVWSKVERAQPLITGESWPTDEGEAWDLCRNPLPPGSEHTVFAFLRSATDLPDRSFFSAASLSDLSPIARRQLEQTLDEGFF